MNAFVRLVLTHLRGFRRDKAAFFWSFFFPLFFIFMFGTLFGNRQPVVPKYRVGVINEDPLPGGTHFIEGLKKVPIFEVRMAGNRESELDALAKGQRRAVIIIPSDFSTAKKGAVSAVLDVRYDQSQPQVWQTIQFALMQLVAGVNQQDSAPPAIRLVSQAIRAESTDSRPIDTMLPGIIAMSIMQLGLFSALPIVRERENGILKRIGATPLPRSVYIASQLTFRVVVGLLQTGLLVCVGAIFYRVPFGGSPVALFAIIALGCLTFMMGGGVLGSIARSTEAAMPMVQLVNFPLMFLGGIFFPVEMLPEVLRPIVRLLPTSHLADAIRGLTIGQATTGDLLRDAAFMTAWMLGGMVVAVKLFRWE